MERESLVLKRPTVSPMSNRADRRDYARETKTLMMRGIPRSSMPQKTEYVAVKHKSRAGVKYTKYKLIPKVEEQNVEKV